MADEFEYTLEHVPATTVASEDIDKTFRSSCIGKSFAELKFANSQSLTPSP